ncbi:MAG: ABC transporter ATP-binding protein [Firmicutes bacterium]|nr:ABC transporter ATP-binding protein [Bacillota bacterium]
MSLIEMDHVTKDYRMAGQIMPILKGISFTVEAGEYVAIIGPSGSGKSTLMHILGGLDIPTDGHYRLDGHDLAGLTEGQLAPIRRTHIGFVFQSFNLINSLTALENVALPLLYQGMPRHEQQRRAQKALEAVGLSERLHHRPGQLSGGQQQRVAIARAMVTDAPVILADEPTGNLDSHAGQGVLALFRQLHAEGHTLLLITHDSGVASEADRMVTIRDGLIVEERRLSHV